MIKVIKSHDLDDLYRKTAGTHKIYTMKGPTYQDLCRYFGEPTINKRSGDDKVYCTWVFEYGDKVYTVYDWKTFSEYETKNNLRTWSIGGNVRYMDFAIHFIKLLRDYSSQPLIIE